MPSDFENLSNHLKGNSNSFEHVIRDAETARDTVLDKEERNLLIQQAHELGHIGSAAMIDAIHSKGYTWPNLKRDCLMWIGRCAQCQQLILHARATIL